MMFGEDSSHGGEELSWDYILFNTQLKSKIGVVDIKNKKVETREP